MPKWEYKHVYVPYHANRHDDVVAEGLLSTIDTGFMLVPDGFDPELERELNQLGDEGWEIVGVSPRIGGRFVQNPSGAGLPGNSGGFAFTVGVELFLKRPV